MQMMTMGINIADLVNTVADTFERHIGMSISEEARREFIQPSLPYQDHVNEELEAGRIDIDFLLTSINLLFQNAVDIAIATGKAEIDGDSARASMQRYCPYLFWC